jgi:hypothetical protein
MKRVPSVDTRAGCALGIGQGDNGASQGRTGVTVADSADDSALHRQEDPNGAEYNVHRALRDNADVTSPSG